MHAPSHSGDLPAGVDPIPVPDSRREAELLCLLLDVGLYPQIRAEERALDGESSRGGASDGRPRERTGPGAASAGEA